MKVNVDKGDASPPHLSTLPKPHLRRLVHHSALVIGRYAEYAHVQRVRQLYALPISPVSIALRGVSARSRVAADELVRQIASEVQLRR